MVELPRAADRFGTQCPRTRPVGIVRSLLCESGRVLWNEIWLTSSRERIWYQFVRCDEAIDTKENQLSPLRHSWFFESTYSWFVYFLHPAVWYPMAICKKSTMELFIHPVVYWLAKEGMLLFHLVFWTAVGQREWTLLVLTVLRMDGWKWSRGRESKYFMSVDIFKKGLYLFKKGLHLFKKGLHVFKKGLQLEQR